MLDISSFFTPQMIAARFKTMDPLETPVMDTVFKVRPQLSSPVVARSRVEKVVKPLPLVRRGSASISVDGPTGSVASYEPISIRASMTITGVDINNLKLLGDIGQEAWAADMQDTLRRDARATTEAMCANSLSGTLNWPIRLETGGWDSYEVIYGTNLSVTPDVLWDASAVKMADVFATLKAMRRALRQKGYGGTIEIWAGSDAYDQLFRVVEDSKTTATIRLEITAEGIQIGSFLVKERAEEYTNPQTDALTPTLAADAVMMIAMDAGIQCPYCALDDIQMGLTPAPLGIKVVMKEDPSCYIVIAESKPFPLVNCKGICTATVLNEE